MRQYRNLRDLDRVSYWELFKASFRDPRVNVLIARGALIGSIMTTIVLYSIFQWMLSNGYLKM